MKTILVLTDFSKNAAHAAGSAVLLAEKLHAGLCLWNCTPKLPLLPGYLGGTLLAKSLAGPAEGRDQLEELALELTDLMTAAGGDYKPQLHTRYREGELGEQLRQELGAVQVEMIVMGAAAGCAAEHLFTGSDTYRVIQAADYPVLIVPPGAALDQLDKVAFATNFEPADLEAVGYLAGLSRVLDFRIEIVHVTLNGDKDREMIEKENSFTARVAALNSPAFSYKEIRGKEVVNRLNRLAKQTGADVLAMTHHQYTFFKSLFNDHTAKKELAHQKVPLLVFPLKAGGW